MKNIIYFVYAKGCGNCKTVRACIASYLDRINQNCDYFELDSESEEALDLAIAYGAEEIPFVVINDNLLLYHDFEFNQDAIGEYIF